MNPAADAAALAPPPADVVAADVARALAEDVGSGDVTAALLPDAVEPAATTGPAKPKKVTAGLPMPPGTFGT